MHNNYVFFYVSEQTITDVLLFSSFQQLSEGKQTLLELFYSNFKLSK